MQIGKSERTASTVLHLISGYAAVRAQPTWQLRHGMNRIAAYKEGKSHDAHS
jgi:hypothetical protein